MCPHNRPQLGRTPDRVIGLEPIVGRQGGRRERNTAEINILIALPRIGPGDIRRLIRQRQAHRVAEIIILLPRGVGECTLVNIKRLIADAEIGTECFATVDTDRSEHIQEVISRVHPGVEPGQTDRSVGTNSQGHHDLVGGNIVRRTAGRRHGVVVVDRDEPLSPMLAIVCRDGKHDVCVIQRNPGSVCYRQGLRGIYRAGPGGIGGNGPRFG